jgi:hypothetical protein
MENYKTCNSCGKIFPATTDYFHKSKSNKFGVTTTCKQCYSKIKKEKYGHKNHEYYLNRKAKLTQEQRERAKENVRKWRIENRERYLNHAKEWRAKNREKSNKWSVEYARKNSRVRVRKTVASLLRKYIDKKIYKSKWETMLGYTWDELVSHLEKQFKDGMSWDNYGEWHIDHIIPQSYLQYSSPKDKEFKKCWALSNLQPLWASENCSKQDRYIG